MCHIPLFLYYATLLIWFWICNLSALEYLTRPIYWAIPDPTSGIMSCVDCPENVTDQFRKADDVCFSLVQRLLLLQLQIFDTATTQVQNCPIRFSENVPAKWYTQTGCLWTWLTGCLQTWRIGCLWTWLTGCLWTWLTGCLWTWLTGCLWTWLTG